jgi:hypothetical protein
VALPTSGEEWLPWLSIRHDAELPELEDLNRYYEGTQNLTYMHPEVFREVSDRIQPVIINWPQLVVDSVEERLDVEGFRLPDEDGEDKDLWRVWQSNNMDEQTQLGNVDALVMKRSYVTVGTDENDADTPILCAESPLEMFADVDPRTRKIRAALRRVIDDSSYAREPERSATLYLPNETIYYQWVDGDWTEQEQTRDAHNLGQVPVAVVVNRGRLSSARTRNNLNTTRARYGRSELEPIIPLSNAANTIATDMMLAADFLALPVRGFFGIAPEDLKDQNGNQLTAYQAILRKFFMIPTGTDEGAGTFEFAGANLGGFHESLNKLAQMVASLAGLPPHYLGFTTDNPASADAIRSAESRLVKRAERKQRPWGGAYEQVCRLVRRFQEGDWDPKLKMLETRWRDPSTPTVAQVADAAVKLYTTAPRPIVNLRGTRERIGLTDAEISRMEKEDDAADAKAAALDPVSVIAQQMPTQPPVKPGMNGAVAN